MSTDPLIAALSANTDALAANTAALHALGISEESMSSDIAALTGVVQQVADEEAQVHTDFQNLLAAVSGATSLSPADKQAIDNATAQLQGTLTTLQADAQAASGTGSGGTSTGPATTSSGG